MSMKALMSAAHAAGYAMAAEELVEPRLEPEPMRTTALVRAPQPVPAGLMKPESFVGLLWLREWFGSYWPGRATA